VGLWEVGETLGELIESKLYADAGFLVPPVLHRVLVSA